MDPGSSSYVATFDGKDALAELVEAEHLPGHRGHATSGAAGESQE